MPVGATVRVAPHVRMLDTAPIRRRSGGQSQADSFPVSERAVSCLLPADLSACVEARCPPPVATARACGGSAIGR